MAPHKADGQSTLHHGSPFDSLESLPEHLGRELSRLEKLFTVDTALLKRITTRFGEELEEGLETQNANIPMNITWVTTIPCGREFGTYLTLDLGGTNLRVCLITLTTPGDADLTQEQYTLPDSIKAGTADDLWAFISETLQEFIDKHAVQAEDGECVPLGFTFSYPATQDRIDHGALQTWTKGWDVKGVEGEDVAAMLRKAIDKRSLPVSLVALVNDTTGALIASAYNDPETIIGAVFGTGCNAAYMERRQKIPKLCNTSRTDRKTHRSTEIHGEEVDEDELMAINCEYGAFDNSHTILPRTRYDEIIDEETPRPGEQTFEKMSAGLYLGEIFRLIMLELVEKGMLFSGGDERRPDVNGIAKSGGFSKEDEEEQGLYTPYILDTEFLSRVENDDDVSSLTSLFASTLNLAPLSSKSPPSSTSSNTNSLHAPSTQELVFLKRVAQLIGLRGARLCACGVSALCLRMGKQKGHVAADGSLANKHPRFRQRWEAAVREIMGNGDADGEQDVNGKGVDGGIKLTSAEDGSGLGAAVICALTMHRVANAR